MSGWLPLLSAWVSHLFFARFFLSRLVYIARYVLSSLNVSSRGTKFEIFREDVSYLHFIWLTVTNYTAVLSRKLNEIHVLLLLFHLYFIQTVNKQLRQLPAKWSPSENRSYHISVNKQRFCEQNISTFGVPVYSEQISYGVYLEMKFTVTWRQFLPYISVSIR